MATLASLIVELGLEDNLSGDLKKTSKKLKTIGTGFTKAGLAMTAGLGGAMVAVGGFALNAASQFDNALDMIAVSTGATGDELDALGQMTRDIFKAIPTDMETAAIAISELANRTDATGESLKELATAEIELARITGTDLSGNIQSTTQMFKKWGIAVDDQVESLDMLFRAGQATGISVDKLSQLMVDNATALSGLGFNYAESLAILSAFEKAGINTASAMAGLKFALAKFAEEGVTDPAAAFTALVESIKNAPTDIIGTQIAIEYFGKKAGPELAAAIRSGNFDLKTLLDTIENGESGIIATAEATNDYAEKLQIAKNNAQDALVPLGILLFDAITKLSPKVIELSEAFERLIASYDEMSPRQQQAVQGAVVLLAIVGPLALALGFIISNITAFGAALGVIIAPLSATVALFVLLAPIIVPVTAALGVLKAAGVDLGAMFNTLKSTIARFKDAASAAITAFVDAGSTALTLLQTDGSQAISDLKDNVLGYIGDLALGANAWLDIIETYFSDAWANVIDNASTSLGTLWANIIAILSGIGSTAYSSGVNIGSQIGNGIIAGINSIWSSVVGFAESLAGAAWDAIQSKLHIKSPSELTTWAGEMLGEGLSDGMANSERKVALAAGSMSGAAISGMAGATYNGGINISVSGAGDPNAVADRVFSRFVREMALTTGGV